MEQAATKVKAATA